MANIKSSEKDIRRIEIRRRRNQAVKSEVRTHIRRFKQAAASDDEAEKVRLYRIAQRAIDRAVSKGVLKANTGSRYKSRLAALI
ncbi:MAG: 30S ribosomal protein S20 [Bacillota bacterium]|nr:30S ribosomal protein S20 [Candidatus Fermentithermobacillaceae bacterium]